MTGFECIRDSLTIFEHSLEISAPIRTVGELARRAGYSVYHFTRLFSAVVGVSPKEYISGRILSEAARRIAGTGTPLATVALDAGYPDYETFSHAFKRRFGLSPKSVRRGGAISAGIIDREHPRHPDASPLADFSAISRRDPEIVSVAPFRLAGLPFYIPEGTRSFHEPWAIFGDVQRRVAGRTDPETYYQLSAWTDADSFSGLSVLCALGVDPSVAQEPLFTVRDVPSATYLKFRHDGDISTMYLTYEFIYRDWLSSHDDRPADFWEFQRYSDGGTTTEIFIPLATPSVSR